jgi:hypothetical protein
MRNKFGEAQKVNNERPAEAAKTAAPSRPAPPQRLPKHGLY